MSGEGEKYTLFSKLNNLVVVCEPIDGLKQHNHEAAVRFAGYKAAYLGDLAKDITPDEIEVYETDSIIEGYKKYPELPRIAYVYMLQTQGLLHDTYVYGVDAKKTISTLINPTEIMDGAVVSGNCVSVCDKNTTYHHLNNSVIHDLFEKHGKELNFVGVVITNGNVYLADKERSSNWSVKLVKFLGIDGVIINGEEFGNYNINLIMNCKKIEEK